VHVEERGRIGEREQRGRAPRAREQPKRGGDGADHGAFDQELRDQSASCGA
jgi:hypothetical protein